MTSRRLGVAAALAVAAAMVVPAQPATAVGPTVDAEYSCWFELDWSSLFAMCHVNSGAIQIVASCGHFELRGAWRGPGSWMEYLDCSPFRLWDWHVEQTP